MNQQDFDGLMLSLIQVIAISNGKMEPARVYKYKKEDFKVIYNHIQKEWNPFKPIARKLLLANLTKP